jgi:hypothetical protein
MKELIQRLSLDECKHTAERVLGMKTMGEIRSYLTRKVKQIWPDVRMFDTSR